MPTTHISLLYIYRSIFFIYYLKYDFKNNAYIYHFIVYYRNIKESVLSLIIEINFHVCLSRFNSDRNVLFLIIVLIRITRILLHFLLFGFILQLL